jgi:hypothetical protein
VGWHNFISQLTQIYRSNEKHICQYEQKFQGPGIDHWPCSGRDVPASERQGATGAGQPLIEQSLRDSGGY